MAEYIRDLETEEERKEMIYIYNKMIYSYVMELLTHTDFVTK